MVGLPVSGQRVVWTASRENTGMGRDHYRGGVGNRSTSGIHRCTVGMTVVSGLPGDVERNTSRYTDFTVGEAKTSFVRQEYRGNWGFEGRHGVALEKWFEVCSRV